MDWLAEATVDVDSIREDAERLYNQTKDHYGDALHAKSAARRLCVADLKAAHKAIPEFKGTVPDIAAFLKGLGPLQTKAREARGNPGTQLPGAPPTPA
ncbi:hypothetical protein [Streptomyces zhihengii]|uniref:hypothetical protein n=1 Tax=Streptomyces zhihengii TaxID=1818004 RepID=UPI0033B80202